jgi:site-specific recombinase XerC
MAVDAPTPDQLGATPAWERALDAYARELSTGGASAATLRAYGRDLAELADWASARRREPGELA